MQPDTKEKASVLEKMGKKIEENKKTPTPVEQWDILAAQVIAKELAPKGFKKLTSGSFRGLEIANHSTPGITKATVRKCQNIGAGLVRGFREKLRKEFDKQRVTAEAEFVENRKKYSATPWYKWKEKRKWRRLGEYWCGVRDTNEEAIEALNRLDIK